MRRLPFDIHGKNAIRYGSVTGIFEEFRNVISGGIARSAPTKTKNNCFTVVLFRQVWL